MARFSLDVWFKNGKRDSVDNLDHEDIFIHNGLLIAARNANNIYGFNLNEIAQYQILEENNDEQTGT